jgi:hypothetical protein
MRNAPITDQSNRGAEQKDRVYCNTVPALLTTTLTELLQINGGHLPLNTLQNLARSAGIRKSEFFQTLQTMADSEIAHFHVVRDAKGKPFLLVCPVVCLGGCESE